MVLYQLSVFLHILSAIIWIGGMFFLALVVVPVTRPLPQQQRAMLFGAVGRRFRTVGWVCIGLLLVTGTINAVYRGVSWSNLFSSELWGSPFGTTLALKLGVVALMLALSFYHDFVMGPHSVRVAEAGGAPAESERLRKTASMLGRLEAILALVVVALAIMLVRGMPF
ncbi:MAG: DUF4149 domain-containing protein [Chloroflexi bacterium]|nr:DUF4149 domain-containing protein [Chloroflexota bacterium]